MMSLEPCNALCHLPVLQMSSEEDVLLTWQSDAGSGEDIKTPSPSEEATGGGEEGEEAKQKGKKRRRETRN